MRSPFALVASYPLVKRELAALGAGALAGCATAALPRPCPTGARAMPVATLAFPGQELFDTPALEDPSRAWQPQPQKATILLVHAHPDDEAAQFGGLLPYYAGALKLPVVAVSMTSGGAGGAGATGAKAGDDLMRVRRAELACAYFTYGMRTPPVLGPFPDSCYRKDLECAWKSWGGKERAVAFITEQIRKYKPEILVGHAFDGEYGHPNHMAAGFATAAACEAAADPQRFPAQVARYGTWRPKKCYVHKLGLDPMTHDWTRPLPALGGRSPHDVAKQGMACHASQGPVKTQPQSVFGLYRRTVDVDRKQVDLLENVDLPTSTLSSP